MPHCYWLRSNMNRQRPPYNRSHQNTPRPGRDNEQSTWDSFQQYPMFDERANSTFGNINQFDNTPRRDPVNLGARPKEKPTTRLNRTHSREANGPPVAPNRAQSMVNEEENEEIPPDATSGQGLPPRVDSGANQPDQEGPGDPDDHHDEDNDDSNDEDEDDHHPEGRRRRREVRRREGRRREGGRREDKSGEGDLLLIIGWVSHFIFSCLSNPNLVLGIVALGLLVFLTGLDVWLNCWSIYINSPWMSKYTCVVGLSMILIFYINRFCLYWFNRSLITLVKILGHPVYTRFTSQPRNSFSSNHIGQTPADTTYVVNNGNAFTDPSPSTFSQCSQNSNRQPSGGWNGVSYPTSTPAASNSRQNNFRHNNSRSNPQSSNFRTDSRYNSLGTDPPRINIREDLNTSYTRENSFYNSLSPTDRTLIDTISPLASTHNLALPKWDGEREKYEDFRLSFMSFIPTIPELLRLEALKRALENCPDALRIIAEFQDTSTETFSGAIIALDYEYDNVVEVIERLTDRIQTLTTTRACSPDEFVNQINKMSVLITKLSRKDPHTRLTLAPLAKEWLKYLPDNIDNQVIRKVQKFGRSWISFENIYALCTDFVKGWRNTKDLIEKRAEAQKSSFKKSQAFSASPNHFEPSPVPPSGPSQSSSPVWKPPDNSTFEEREVLYARAIGKPKCCFCHEDTHPSANCPKLEHLTTIQIFERFFSKNSMSDHFPKVRCYLCVEQGHSVNQCVLTQHKIVPSYQCNCNIKPAHNQKLCTVLAHKTHIQTQPK